MSDNKERNEAVAQMEDAIMVAVKGVTQTINSHHLIHLYNAGYRKQGKVVSAAEVRVEWHNDEYANPEFAVFFDTHFTITRKVK